MPALVDRRDVGVGRERPEAGVGGEGGDGLGVPGGGEAHDADRNLDHDRRSRPDRFRPAVVLGLVVAGEGGAGHEVGGRAWAEPEVGGDPAGVLVARCQALHAALHGAGHVLQPDVLDIVERPGARGGERLGEAPRIAVPPGGRRGAVLGGAGIDQYDRAGLRRPAGLPVHGAVAHVANRQLRPQPLAGRRLAGDGELDLDEPVVRPGAGCRLGRGGGARRIRRRRIAGTAGC